MFNLSGLRKIFLNLCIINLDFIFLIFCFNRYGNRVALVRLDAIGDFFLWLPYASIYKRMHPERELILIANSTWADFARELPYWDTVYSVDTKLMVRSLTYRWKTLKKVCAIGASIAIQPTFSREILCGDSIVRATRAEKKIGSVSDLSNITMSEKLLSNRWYSRLIAAAPDPMMELDRNAEFVRNLYSLEMNLAEKKIPLHDITLRDDLLIKEKYFIVFPGASWVGKIWPLDRYTELASWICAKYNLRLVVCGAKAEIEMGNKLLSNSKCSDAVNLAGKTSLSEFYQVVQRALFLVGNDTSAVHIAATVGVPSVCIIGGGHYGRFMPYPEGWSEHNPIPVYESMPCYGCGWSCTQKTYDKTKCVPCIDSIEIDAVKRAIAQIVENKNNPFIPIVEN